MGQPGTPAAPAGPDYAAQGAPAPGAPADGSGRGGSERRAALFSAWLLLLSLQSCPRGEAAVVRLGSRARPG